MYHLRLIKALSYRGAVSATRNQPDAFTDDEAIAQAAVASGYFELVSAANADEPDAGDVSSDEDDHFAGVTEGAPDYDTLSAMTKDELIAYAKEREIDLPKNAKKVDILAAISVFYGGSYTMIDLQKE